MLIEFKTNKLEKCFENSTIGQRTLGQEVARKYIQRIQIIQQTKSIDELMSIPGLHCHPLVGDRDGQYGITLTGFFRLIVSIEDGVVTIEEVSKHYGD